MIVFACPSCAKQFKVPDEMAGRQSRCTQCSTPLTVPASTAAVAAWQQGAPQPVPPPMSAPSPYDVGGVARPADDRFGFLKNKFVIAGVAGVFGVVMLGAVVWGGYRLLFGGSGLGAEVRYLPDNTQAVVSLRPEQVLNSDAYKELKKEIMADQRSSSSDPEKEFEQVSGLPLNNMQQVVVGFSAGGNSEGIIVVKTVKPVTADEIKSKRGGSPPETKVGNYSVYEAFPMAWCVAEPKIVVFGKLDQLKKVLERNKDAELSAGLKTALKHADFSKSAVMAVDVKEVYAKTKEESKKQGVDFDKMIDQIGIANPMGDIDAMTYSLDVGKDIKYQSVSLCKDSKTAEDMKVMSDGLAVFLRRLFPKYGGDSFDTWESSTSGSKMTASMTLKTESIVKFIKAIKDLGKSANQTFTTVGQQLGEPGRPPMQQPPGQR